MKTTPIVIGGNTYDVPEPNFAALEMAWTYIEEAIFATNPVAGPTAGLAIFVCIFMEAEDWDVMQHQWEPMRKKFNVDDKSTYQQQFEALHLWFKRRCLAREINDIRTALNAIMEDAGIVAKPGELVPAPEETPSTETSTASLPSSSQPESKEEAGTASESDGT
jgi:hypothetical protein